MIENQNMEIFFYFSPKGQEVPFKVLYEKVGSKNELLISNREQVIANFEAHKDRIIDEAIGDNTITVPIVFVPVKVKKNFLDWINKAYENVEWNENKKFSKPKMPEIVGASETNNFLQQIEITEGWKGIVKIEKASQEINHPPPNPVVKPNITLKLVWGILIIITVILFVKLCVPPKPPNGKNDNGILTITTSFPDSEVYINGKKQEQKTPIIGMKVAAGNIKIKLVHSNDAVDEKCATITLLPNESKNIGDEGFKNCTSQE